MDKIKKILYMVFLMVIILIITICMLIKGQEKKAGENENVEFSNYGGDATPVKYNNGFEDVIDSRMFFSIENAVNKYEKICRINTDIDYSEEFFDEDEYLSNIKNDETKNQAIYDLLDKNYIKSKNINAKNVSDFIFNIDSDTIILPKKMIYKYGNNCNTYIYETYFIKGNEIENKSFIVRVNNKNSTFSLEFVNEEYDDINSINVNLNDDDIENTGYNVFKTKNVKTEEVAKAYMDNYKQLVSVNPSVIYNNYMNSNYKSKRYGSLEEFENYVYKNIDEIKRCQVTKYATESLEDGKVQYVCVDQYGNYYIFDESSTMMYNIKFDNYTIATDKFRETYMEADDEKKIQMNIDKFIQMINRHDYKTSYSCISEGFKKNYFDTQEKFENYIKNNFYEYNNFEFESIEKKGSNIYVCKFYITDSTGENSEQREQNIIMQLNDNLDFEMSFGVE